METLKSKNKNFQDEIRMKSKGEYSITTEHISSFIRFSRALIFLWYQLMRSCSLYIYKYKSTHSWKKKQNLQYTYIKCYFTSFLTFHSFSKALQSSNLYKLHTIIYKLIFESYEVSLMLDIGIVSSYWTRFR